jgi:hypothetical protein
VEGWTGSGWTGVTIRTEVPGPDPAVDEIRLVRSVEVVVLVVAPGTNTTSDRSTTTWRRSPTDWADHFRQQLPLR